MLKKFVLSTAALITNVCACYADTPLIAGYLDTTATGSALKVNMSQASQDG